MVAFAASDGWPIQKPAIQNEPLDNSTPVEPDKIIDELIEQRAFMVSARDDTHTGVEEEFSGPVGVD